MRTIVLGLGNPILGDDGIGCRVVQEVERRLNGWGGREVEIDPFYRGGLALMERLIGYDKAIIVDSIQGLNGLPGTLLRLTLDHLPSSSHVDSSHDTSLKTALEMGRRLGAELPTEIVILGVEIAPSSDFREGLSPEAEGRVESVVQAVLDEIISPERN
jgi:hydrogenase maturation protease